MLLKQHCILMIKMLRNMKMPAVIALMILLLMLLVLTLTVTWIMTVMMMMVMMMMMATMMGMMVMIIVVQCIQTWEEAHNNPPGIRGDPKPSLCQFQSERVKPLLIESAVELKPNQTESKM